MANLLETTPDEEGEANRKLTQILPTANADAPAVAHSARDTPESKNSGRYSNRPEMKGTIHPARTYRIILVLVLVIGGGMAGVYGIKARPSFSQTGKDREMPPNDPPVINFFAPAIPRSYEDKIKVSRRINAEIEWKDANQKSNFTLERSIFPGNYDGFNSSSFETFPPKLKVWDGNISVHIEQAKAYTQPKILEGQYIDINLSAQILSIFEDGKLLDSYLVSTGKRGKETPRGTHVIANKNPRAWSQKYGVFMPYWMAITPGGSFGIHELPEWPDGDKDGANDLGSPVSHGCVRLGIGPAERVYNWAEIGTPVVVY